MATKIPIGTSAYYTDFAGGQGGGAGSYYTYAEDLDTDFLLLRQTINQMIDEISAVSGPNATTALDLVLWDDVDNPISAAELNFGVVGAASYEVSVEGGGTLKIKKGQAFVLGQKVTLIADMTGVTSSGGAGTRWVAIDANGAVYIETAASGRALDIASVYWNGSQFVAPVTHLAEVFFDGDSWAEIRDRAVTPGIASLAAYTFRRGAERIRAMELFLSGHNTGAEGEAIAGPLVILPGTEGNPALILGNGTSTFDTTSGWYRPGADVWGYSGAGSLLLSLMATGLVFAQLGDAAGPILRHTGGAGLYFLNSGVEVGIACGADAVVRFKSASNNPQALIADGVVGAPSLALDTDEDSGWYSPAAAEWALALAGAKAFHFTAGALRIPDGAVGVPALTFESDLDTGIYSPGVGRLAVANAGAKSGEFDAAGNLDLPTNTGAIVRRTSSQTIAVATPTPISWDTEDRDVGGLITVTSTDLTIPSDGDGLYIMALEVEWAGTVTNTAFKEIWIKAAGTAYGIQRYDTYYNAVHRHTTVAVVPLSASDVVQGCVEHGEAATRDINSARFAIQKIA